MRLISRRSWLGSAIKVAAVSMAVACGPRTSPSAVPASNTATAPPAQSPPGGQPGQAPSARTLRPLELPFCSQVLCILPFEVARQRGFFEAEGLNVSLIYMRGGTQAINALLSGSAEFAGSGFDLVVQSVASGRPAVSIASTSRLPFFALAVSPHASFIRSIHDLAGKRIGVGNLATTDHLVARYLLNREGLDPSQVEFVATGPNLFEQLVRGQIEAGMVQEPGLTLLERAGGSVLVNLMKLDDAQKYLGGPYHFMGLHTRPEVLANKPETARGLVRALAKGTRWILDNPGETSVKAAPPELVAGGDVEVFAGAVDRYRKDLYPDSAMFLPELVERVIDVQRQSGAIEPSQTVNADELFTNEFAADSLALIPDAERPRPAGVEPRPVRASLGVEPSA